MKKTEIIKGIIVLVIITSLSGYLLANVYNKTKPEIEKQEKVEKERINKEIFPEGKNFVEGKLKENIYYDVYDENGKLIGKIFEIKTLGYGGYIYLAVGIDNELKIKGVKVIKHSETPGLGSKITKKEFLEQFNEKTVDQIYLKPKGEIDAITGATISSKAIVEGIRKLIEEIKNEKNN